MKYTKMLSKILYTGRIFNVRKDTIRAETGNEFEIDIVEHAGAVTIIPLDDSDQIWFVRQYRHPIQQNLLELPAGVMDESELPEISAQRELREEIGMAADELTLLGEFYLAPGYSTEYMYIFLARGLQPAPLQPDEDENIQIEKHPLENVIQLIKSGEIQDSKSLAGLYLLHLKMNETQG